MKTYIRKFYQQKEKCIICQKPLNDNQYHREIVFEVRFLVCQHCNEVKKITWRARDLPDIFTLDKSQILNIIYKNGLVNNEVAYENKTPR